MKKIGLVGEDPNDTIAIKNLLNQKFSNNLKLAPILKHIKGSNLDNITTVKSLEIELEHNSFDYIFFVRDLDGLKSEARKLAKINAWYNSLNKISGGKGILLLNIYELEALIFADIETFNKIYKTSLKGNRNVMFIDKPKEELMRATRKLRKNYKENHCPDLFLSLQINAVIKNCSYFSEFVSEINDIINPKKGKK